MNSPTIVSAMVAACLALAAPRAWACGSTHTAPEPAWVEPVQGSLGWGVAARLALETWWHGRREFDRVEIADARLQVGGFVATHTGWSAGLDVPVVRRSVTLPSARKLAVLGLGDVSAWGAYTLSSPSVFGGVLSLGLTAPTGMQGELEGETLRLDDLATGAGALQVTAQGLSTIAIPLGEFFAGADISAPLLHTRDERVGLSAGAEVGITLTPHEVLRVEGAAVGHVVGSSTTPDGARVADTGGEWLAVSAQLAVALPIGLGFEVGGELPVHESLRGAQSRGWIGRLGVRFSPAAAR